jgi:hypothetical protein
MESRNTIPWNPQGILGPYLLGKSQDVPQKQLAEGASAPETKRGGLATDSRTFNGRAFFQPIRLMQNVPDASIPECITRS